MSSSPSDINQGRILSIQSHVVSGYVGNKAAVFPLQLLGFDVDIVNSVHFSNHTGYANGLQGDVLQGDQLRQILQGLKDNNLLDGVQHILTGYIGSASFLESVLEVIEAVRRAAGPSSVVRYVCDPVLGDDGEFYVPESLVEVYRTKVLPVADVVTPNQFEVEQLTGIRIETMADALTACTVLHEMGPSLVFITSMILEETSDQMTIVASQQQQQNDNETTTTTTTTTTTREVWKIQTPILEGSYTGTGDLTTSLLLGHTARTPNDLKGAMEKVIATMHVVIQRTQQHAKKVATTTTTTNPKQEKNPDDDWISNVAAKELRLIQSKKDIENPPFLFEAERCTTTGYNDELSKTAN